jgi:hypothetical protein
VIGKAVAQLMSLSYLLPTQQAALFELTAETPGFQMVSSMTDAIGRTGVGIEWTGVFRVRGLDSELPWVAT